MVDLPYSILLELPASAPPPVLAFSPAREWKPPLQAVENPDPWASLLVRARREGRLLFDGPLSRLEGIVLQGDRARLHLGRTTYRAYVETRTGPCDWDPGARRAHPLAVCAALETDDGRIVMETRERVEGHAGCRHVIGGWVDPERDTGPDPRTAMAREIGEELGLEVAPQDLACLGLVFDRLLSHPELCFHGRIPLASSAVSALEGDGEVTGLHTLPLERVGLAEALCAGEVSPTGLAALVLLGGRLWGAGWRDGVERNLRAG